jgi:diguanylate cyclase (GGDEF)-like protein
VGLAAVAVLFFRTRREVQAIASAAAQRERMLAGRVAELQGSVDFLSAEREISLVLNEDVDFRNVLDRVLAISCDALGGPAELWVREKSKLVLRAARRDGKTSFDLSEREDRALRQCFEDGRLFFASEAGRLRAMAPLQADREIVGVVRFTIPFEGSPGLRQGKAELLAKRLPELSKMLALAVKTPDLYTRAVQDGLTKLWTKRHFESQLAVEVSAAKRYGEPLSLIMVDVDHFKKVNDTRGHPFGDRVLRGVAGVLRRRVRGGSAFRYGGEEMAVLLPKTEMAKAEAVAERLRVAIENLRVGGLTVTASFGVATVAGASANGKALVQGADKALYRAKEGGRNRVVTSSRRWQRAG